MLFFFFLLWYWRQIIRKSVEADCFPAKVQIFVLFSAYSLHILFAVRPVVSNSFVRLIWKFSRNPTVINRKTDFNLKFLGDALVQIRLIWKFSRNPTVINRKTDFSLKFLGAALVQIPDPFHQGKRKKKKGDEESRLPFRFQWIHRRLCHLINVVLLPGLRRFLPALCLVSIAAIYFRFAPHFYRICFSVSFNRNRSRNWIPSNINRNEPVWSQLLISVFQLEILDYSYSKAEEDWLCMEASM